MFSDVARHHPHVGQPDARVRVPGEGPEAVHGRLRGHPSHQQC